VCTLWADLFATNVLLLHARTQACGIHVLFFLLQQPLPLTLKEFYLRAPLHESSCFFNGANRISLVL
jgi:hypothetical protein